MKPRSNIFFFSMNQFYNNIFISLLISLTDWDINNNHWLTFLRVRDLIGSELGSNILTPSLSYFLCRFTEQAQRCRRERLIRSPE